MNILPLQEFTDCHIIIKCDKNQINELCLTSEMEEMNAKAFSSGKNLMHSCFMYLRNIVIYLCQFT